MTSKILGLWLAGMTLATAATEGSRKLTVAVVQFRSSFDVGRNCERMAGQLKKLAEQGVQVAVFPECALTGYHTRPVMEPSADEIETAEQRLRQTCRTAKIAAVIGSVYKIGGRAYDTAVVFNSQGELVERYGKVYLAGEKWATPGNHVAFFELEGVPSTVIICHDERYPELLRLPAMEGARVAYYVSSESGLREEHKIAPYRAQVMARAVENQMFLVQSNAPANPDLSGSHGQSRIIGPDGNVLKEASFFAEDTLIETLEVKPGRVARPLEGPLGDWWRQGITWMLQNRHRSLE